MVPLVVYLACINGESDKIHPNRNDGDQHFGGLVRMVHYTSLLDTPGFRSQVSSSEIAIDLSSFD